MLTGFGQWRGWGSSKSGDAGLAFEPEGRDVGFWDTVLASVLGILVAAGILAILRAFLELRKRITAQLVLGFGIALVVIANAVVTLGIFRQVIANQIDIAALQIDIAALQGQTVSLSNNMPFVRIPKQEEGSGDESLRQAENLNATADPRFGEVELAAGFLPDPSVQRVTVGGPVHASDLDLGEDCIGYTAEAPDVRLTWNGTSEELHISFAADDSDDTTLVIGLPDGSWSCNDDYGPFSLDPLVSIKTPGSGPYNIWVGSYLPGREVSGELSITELDPDWLWPFADR